MVSKDIKEKQSGWADLAQQNGTKLSLLSQTVMLLTIKSEKRRQIEFYKKKGLQMPHGDAYEDDKKNIEKNSPDKEDNKDYHRLDEQVNVCLECLEINVLKSLKRKILRLSSQATVTHLKKFVALKVFGTIDRYKDVNSSFVD
ncbi:polycomb group RING finger protein 3-like [Ruditapes philippinarum]|uniref:polycomb group RING finger protein 3-like n=1 Tax=Ruditapes philippinarum TaxID=129788 RepID=UPI00295B72C9|nr:polycomb group RING finger protein 3-like [Ruditapes philippinarum]